MKLNELKLDPEQSNYWDFEILDGVNFLNCNRIHPLKQREIQRLTCLAGEDEGIEGIVIFGSATQFRCNSRSDIDMVVFRKDIKKQVPEGFFDIDSELDIFFTIGEKLEKILYDYGVVVYRRTEYV